MIRVFQTEGKGDCFQACIASILEIPLEQAFDFNCHLKEDWFPAFNEWLVGFGLGCIHIKWKPVTPAITRLLGYHIAEIGNLEDKGTHAVVIYNEELIHDPNPDSEVSLTDLVGVYLIVLSNITDILY